MAFIVNCYDLLIKNGTVVDPGNGIHKKMDIGIYGSRIVDVFEPGTKPGKICGGKVIDASGMTVVPGLVDGHAHVLPGLRFSYPVDELWKRGITAGRRWSALSSPGGWKPPFRSFRSRFPSARGRFSNISKAEGLSRPSPCAKITQLKH